MSGIVTLTSDPAVIDYRLSAGGHGCASDAQFSYHANGGERPLRWIGSGVTAHGLTVGAQFTAGDEDRARALMSGVDPATGERLVSARRVIFDDAKVDALPLLAAVVEAQSRGVTVTAKSHQRMLTAMQKCAAAAGGGRALYRSDEAGTVADALGLDVDEVWGEGVYEAAYANLFTTQVNEVDDGVVEEVVARRKTVGNAGYDFTFTLPKSSSVLLAFADEQTANDMEDTLYGEVSRSFGWLEQRTAYVMRGKHGRDKNGVFQSAKVADGDGFRGWTMVHRSARPVDGAPVGDPHWHVHTTFANMTRAADGKYGTIAAGGRDLMRHMRSTSALYEALVRHSMAQRFGVQFDRRESGQWEIVGVPDATIALFSKRRDEVETMLRDLGFSPAEVTAAVARMANSRTRGAKGALTTAEDATLQQLWRQEARAAGYRVEQITQDAFTGSVNPVQEMNRDALVREVAEQLQNVDEGLTSFQRRFTRLDAMAAVAHALPGGVASPADLEVLTDDVLAQAGFVDLPEGTDVGVGGDRLAASHMRDAQRLTTADVVAAEELILQRVRDDAPIYAAVSAQQLHAGVQAAEAEQGFTFSGEQLEAVTRLALDGRAVNTLLGPPGTGKTTIMRGLQYAMAAGGLRVGGGATAAVAAQNLQREAGITSWTVAQLSANPRLLDEIDVLVLDEANLTEDRARAQLYRSCESAGVRIVEVGDSLQLRGVGVGSLYRRIHQIAGGPELVANRRQGDALDRAAIHAWREGEFADALRAWAGRGQVVTDDTGVASRAAMLRAWSHERAGAPDAATEIHGLLMLAGTNETVDLLNRGAHELRRRAGELGQGYEYSDTLTFATGDYVVLRSNDRDQRMTRGDVVLNGIRAAISAIDGDGTLRVTWRDGEQERHAELSKDYVRAGGVRWGYALTVHAAEGLTVGETWTGDSGAQRGGTVLVAAAGMDDPLLHVATSRHRRAMTIFASLEEWQDEQQQWQHGDPLDADERTERIISAIAQSAARSRVNVNERPVLADLGDRAEAEAWQDFVGANQPTRGENSTTGDAAEARSERDTRAAAWPALRRWLTSAQPGEDRSPTAHRALNLTADPAAGWLDRLDAEHDARGRWLLTLARRRAEDLGAAEVQRMRTGQSEWAHWSIPDDAQQRAVLQQQVGAIAAWREAFGVTGTDPLGPRPQHAALGGVWDAAQLGLPDAPEDEGLRWRRLGDTQLATERQHAEQRLQRALRAQSELERDYHGEQSPRVTAQQQQVEQQQALYEDALAAGNGQDTAALRERLQNAQQRLDRVQHDDTERGGRLRELAGNAAADRRLLEALTGEQLRRDAEAARELAPTRQDLSSREVANEPEAVRPPSGEHPALDEPRPTPTPATQGPALRPDVDAWDRAIEEESQNPYLGRSEDDLARLRAEAQRAFDRARRAIERSAAVLDADEHAPGERERATVDSLQGWQQRAGRLQQAEHDDRAAREAIAESVEAVRAYAEHGKVTVGRRGRQAWEQERKRLAADMERTKEAAIEARGRAHDSARGLPPRQQWATEREQAGEILQRGEQIMREARAQDASVRDQAREVIAREQPNREHYGEQLRLLQAAGGDEHGQRRRDEPVTPAVERGREIESDFR